MIAEENDHKRATWRSRNLEMQKKGTRDRGRKNRGVAGQCPPGRPLQRHTRRPGLQPGTTRCHRGRPGGFAGAERPAGNPDHPAIAGRAPAAARHPPCREAPGQEPQGDRGQGQRGGRAGRSQRRAAERYLSGRAPLPAELGSSQRPPRFKRDPVHGPAAPAREGRDASLPGPHGCGRGATAASHGPGRKYGGIGPARPFPAPGKVWHS